MVSPRLRPAVPLPAPIDTAKIRQVLGIATIASLAFWVLPALLLPAPWFPMVGIPEPALEQLVFVRLWGAVSSGLVAGYTLAWRAPTRHPVAILVGIVANALMSIVIVRSGASGAFGTWTTLGAVYVWGSALVAAGLAVALATTGQPLLRRLTERPRPGSVKVM